jgi:cyclase
VVLNASKGEKNILEFSKILERIVDDVFIPISAGGGIRTIEDAELLFNSGADKIVLNTILVENKKLVSSLVNRFGSQSIVASIDYRSDGVYVNNGMFKINKDLKEYIEDIELLGVGEIYLNSIDNDGTGFGYDFETINKIVKKIKIPLIIAGGAGNVKHLAQGLNIDRVNAVATANLFNFIGDCLKKSRERLLRDGQQLASWGDKIK